MQMKRTRKRIKKLKKGDSFIDRQALWLIEDVPEIDSLGQLVMLVSTQGAVDKTKHYANKRFVRRGYITVYTPH